MSEGDGGGWTVVRRSHKGARRLARAAQKTEADAEAATEEEERSSLTQGQWRDIVDALQTRIARCGLGRMLDRVNASCPVYCYGLGSGFLSKHARHSPSNLQLALVQLLAGSRSVSFYDPAHTKREEEALSVLGWIILPSESLAVPSEGALLFMPHCDRHLYVRAVEENAAHLKDVQIVGNSFIAYHMRDPLADAVDNLVIANRVRETDMGLLDAADSGLDLAVLERAFNDLCLIEFVA